MFEPSTAPRIFATPLGVDFSTALLDGLDRQLQGESPEALARVELYVNTTRTARRLKSLFSSRGATFLPRIRLIADLAGRPEIAGVPPAIPPLRLRLQISRLVAALLDREPDLAPRASLYGLSDSLANLMGEMLEEEVSPEAISGLDVGDHSQHWQRSQTFLSIVAPFFVDQPAALPLEARQGAVVDRLITTWSKTPPIHPVIVAGSTGSRGPTARFMQAVARLPQGAVVLPGLDYDQPDHVWRELSKRGPDGTAAEDHPQFRFAKIAADAGIDPLQIVKWTTAEPANVARNRLVSLAMRPAPVTDQWLAEGPALCEVPNAMRDVTLIEAPSPQAEATAIALRLREAVETGETAALISPDRGLTRQVIAALDRWGILPDDSAGEPLSLAAPGRLLRHVAEAGAAPLTAESLLVLLKHPLTHSGRDDRGQHLLRTRDLELQVLRKGKPFPNRADLVAWAEKRGKDTGAMAWVGWVTDAVLSLYYPAARDLRDHVDQHISASEALSAGPGQDGAGMLWQRETGQSALSIMTALRDEAGHGGQFSAAEYRDFVAAILSEEEAREPVRPHPRIMIWGTLEARVQSADVVILAGLNEGSWPQATGADAWLNRRMRAQAGLRLPERVVGLSAHDFQQSVAGPKVWLTRAKRDAEAETVPSRWLNRITNLMMGASAEAAQTLQGMRDRGGVWLAHAQALDTPKSTVDPAPRPAPCPPVSARPDGLSVTQVEKLIRDPYAIYAGKILRLRPLDPLRQRPDAPLRGTVVHDVLRAFVEATMDEVPEAAEALLTRIAEERFEQTVPWPATRRLWRARIARIAPKFVAGEHTRRLLARPHLLEAEGKTRFDDLGFTLKGTADRIDLTPDGKVVIYDYKTGAVPSDKQEKSFNKQLWLEAVMAANGAFGEERIAERIAYIGLGGKGEEKAHPVDLAELADIEKGFAKLISHFQSAAVGYVSRRAMVEVLYDGDFDHLARFGEWDATQEARLQKVGS